MQDNTIIPVGLYNIA